MSQDPQKSADPHKSPIFSKKGLLQGGLFFFFVVLLLIAGIAWRKLDSSTLTHFQSVVVATATQSPVMTAEVNEQTRSSSGIILATVVIVLIILGGTFGATRRKSP